MEEKLEKLLESGLEVIPDVTRTPLLLQRLEVLYDQISLFNPVYGLTAEQGEALVARHILDCLAPWQVFGKYTDFSGKTADLGSGAGLPGLVLASACEKMNMCLVERMGRRAGFLRSTIPLMGLSARVSVEEKDLCTLETRDADFSTVVFRAFRPLKDIAADLVRITSENAVVFIYKSGSRNIEEEKRALDAAVPHRFEVFTEPYRVPFLDAERTLLILRKLA